MFQNLLFFHLIRTLYDKSTFLATNKSPNHSMQWKNSSATLRDSTVFTMLTIGTEFSYQRKPISKRS